MTNASANVRGMVSQLNAAADPVLSLVQRAAASLAVFSQIQFSNAAAAMIPAMVRLTAASHARIEAANAQAQYAPGPQPVNVVSLVSPMPVPTQRPSSVNSRGSRASRSDLSVASVPVAGRGARSNRPHQETDAEKIAKVIQLFSLYHSNLTQDSVRQWVRESGCCDRTRCIHDFKQLVLHVFVDAWHMHSTEIKTNVLDRIVRVFGQERTINRVTETQARREERIEMKLKQVVEGYLGLQCGLNLLPRVVDEHNRLAVPGSRSHPAYSMQIGYATLHRILIHV